jgi:hypothetical protein
MRRHFRKERRQGRAKQTRCCEKKEWGEIQTKNLMGNNQELCCLELQGGIELISCDQGQNEGFMQLFTAECFCTKMDDREGKRVLRDLKEKTGPS